MAATLMMVMLHAMRRRGIVPPETIEAAGLRLAPYGQRLLAGIIDAIPVIGTLVLAAWKSGQWESSDPQAIVDAIKYPYSIAIAVYVLHTLVSEWLWGWTIGKRLCGLRVVMVDGTAPTFRAAVVRNLLRVVDVALVFPPMLVIITPLRQRVGDLAADTIVVSSEAAPGHGGDSG